MIIQHPGFLGFVQYLMFPLLGLLLELEGYVLGTPFPVSAFSALFSLSLVLLILYSPLIAYKVDERPGAALAKFARGAYYAGLVMCALTFLLFGSAAFLYHQGSVGFGYLFLGVGTISLPLASAAGAYGKMLATSEDESKDFLNRLRERRSFEAGAAGYLALWLGKAEVLRRDLRPTLALIGSIAFCLFGWMILEVSGGFPYALFGIVVLFAYLVISGLEVRTLVPREKRTQVSDLLTASLPAAS
jgi:hypothetical protein